MPVRPIRVLFVDDDEDVLKGLRTALRPQRRRWLMHFANGHEPALTILASEPLDVVVTDMRMPGMDGADLLARVRDQRPETIRVVLSGEASDEQKLRSVQVAHQWLTKPCDRDRLVQAITRAVTTRDLLESRRVKQVVGSTTSLPTLPRAYSALMSSLGSDESSAEEVAAIVAEDASLAARMLQMANSAFFCLPREVGDIHEAVMMLGFETIRHIVFAAEVIEALEPADSVAGFSLDEFHENAILVSRIAPRFVDDPDWRPHTATAGLLHDLGQLLLAKREPEGFAQACAASARDGLPRHQAEARRLGVSHAELGAALLGYWGLPTEIVQAVAHHHLPSRVAPTEVDALVAVHIAQALVEQERARGSEEGDLPLEHGLDVTLIQRLDLTGCIDEWRAIVRDEMSAGAGDAEAA